MTGPSYVGSFPTPTEETAKAYIGTLPAAVADYARASLTLRHCGQNNGA